MDGLNYGTRYFFREFAKGNPGLDPVFQAVNVLGSIAVIPGVAIALVCFLLGRGGVRPALITVGIMLFGFAVLEGLNVAISPAQPDEPDAATFASRAAFLSALIYGLVPFVFGAGLTPRRRIFLISLCIVLVLAIAFSQLYLRIDYLTGVLAGWAWAGFLLLLWQQLTADALKPAPG